MLKNGFTCLLVSFTLLQSAFSQNLEIQYEVNRVYPFISVSKDNLSNAKSLNDISVACENLDHYYKSSWVKKFVSLEISVRESGKLKTALSKSEAFTSEQKQLMNRADEGSDINVKIKYLPDNTLSFNKVQQIDFSFSVEPVKEAKYFGGMTALNQFLDGKLKGGIPDDTFKQYQLAAVKFKINEDGEVVDAHIFWTSENEKVDQLLLKTIREMPCWSPAEYEGGSKISQEFALMIGDMESCVSNMLNLRLEH